MNTTMRPKGDTTGQMNQEVSTMAKPTPSTATPKRVDERGKKRNPPTALAGDGGLQSSSTNELEHKEILPAQEQTHNTNNDRVGIKSADEAHQSQESRNPLGHDSEGASKETVGPSPSEHFKSALWERQVLEADHEELLSSTILVLLTLGVLFDERGECWPSQALLAKMTKLTVKTVKKQTDIAEKLGLLEIDRAATKNGKRAIIYRAKMLMS